MGSMHSESTRDVTIINVDGRTACEKRDAIGVEEPLAIQIGFGPIGARRRVTVSVTMRTPGDDAELAVGLLVAEGIVTERGHILSLAAAVSGNAVRVEIHPTVSVDFARLERHGFTSSSCGICGKTSIEAVEAACESAFTGVPRIAVDVIHTLPRKLREAQPGFTRTGALHAAALFDRMGMLQAVREDVGRHNAVDKLIGAEFLAKRLPLSEHILFVSGRAGFELVQKAAVAGIAIFAAVGAPTSLAIDLAERLNLTLLGFVREGRFNIYSGAERVAI